MASDKSYTLDLITAQDEEEVIQFVNSHFFREEPTCVNINLTGTEEASASADLWTQHLVHDGCSVKAVNSIGKIIGVFMNKILKRNDELELPELDENLLKIIRMLEHCKTSTNLFERYPGVDTIMDANMLSVHEDFRGLGVGKAMLEKTIDIAKEQNISYCYVLCTSYFTTVICKKLNFTEIFSLAYKDYVENGKQVFTPPAPHTNVVAYIKKL